MVASSCMIVIVQIRVHCRSYTDFHYCSWPFIYDGSVTLLSGDGILIYTDSGKNFSIFHRVHHTI